LGDAYDGAVALQFLEREAEIQVTLDIERRHVGVGRVVEPGARAQAALELTAHPRSSFLVEPDPSYANMLLR
jgi:hypothetical protein